jgi:hypothetical protein
MSNTCEHAGSNNNNGKKSDRGNCDYIYPVDCDAVKQGRKTPGDRCQSWGIKEYNLSSGETKHYCTFHAKQAGLIPIESLVKTSTRMSKAAEKRHQRKRDTQDHFDDIANFAKKYHDIVGDLDFDLAVQVEGLQAENPQLFSMHSAKKQLLAEWLCADRETKKPTEWKDAARILEISEYQITKWKGEPDVLNRIHGIVQNRARLIFPHSFQQIAMGVLAGKSKAVEQLLKMVDSIDFDSSDEDRNRFGDVPASSFNEANRLLYGKDIVQ